MSKFAPVQVFPRAMPNDGNRANILLIKVLAPVGLPKCKGFLNACVSCLKKLCKDGYKVNGEILDTVSLPDCDLCCVTDKHDDFRPPYLSDRACAELDKLERDLESDSYDRYSPSLAEINSVNGRFQGY